jgi:hypothetical protein
MSLVSEIPIKFTRFRFLKIPIFARFRFLKDSDFCKIPTKFAKVPTKFIFKIPKPCGGLCGRIHSDFCFYFNALAFRRFPQQIVRQSLLSCLQNLETF